MARVLVIGAGGFVGHHVVFVLWERELRVVSPRANTTGRQYALLDSSDRSALVEAEEPEILIHLARVTEHGRFWSSPLYAAWEPASIDLFEQLYSCGGRHAIGIGSCAEYGWTTDAQWFREDIPLAPRTNYGAAKAGTAEALARLAKAYAASAAWDRVFFLFWPGELQTRPGPLMIDAVAHGVVLDCRPVAATRDYWDVRNLGAAVVELALSSLEGSINRASDAPIRFDAIGAIIERHFAHAKVIHFDQRPLGPGKPLRLVADMTRLRAEFGFTNSVSFTKGLRTYSEAMP